MALDVKMILLTDRRWRLTSEHELHICHEFGSFVQLVEFVVDLSKTSGVRRADLFIILIEGFESGKDSHPLHELTLRCIDVQCAVIGIGRIVAEWLLWSSVSTPGSMLRRHTSADVHPVPQGKGT